MKNKNKQSIIFIFVLLLVLVGLSFFVFKFLNFNLKNSSDRQEVDKNEKEDESIEKDLFEDYYDDAEKIMETMSIENKISQLFFIKYQDDLKIDDTSYIGGFVFFGNDFTKETKTSFKEKVDNLQSQSKIRYAFAVDEEGGTVTRVSRVKAFRDEKFLSPRDLYELGGLDLIIKTEEEKIALLKEIGLNLNLAPVADISKNAEDFIYLRSIGLDAKETANYISKVTSLYYDKNFSSCLKHFPGYGANADTHTGISIDNRTIEDLKNEALIPFASGIEAKTPFILISHNIMKNIDGDLPSTLSSKVINILKEDLNYTGLIITDDLSMKALDSYRGDSDIATLALLAGNDVLLSNEYNKHYNELIKAYKSGIISEDRINYSVKKIIAWKLAYKIIFNEQ